MIILDTAFADFDDFVSDLVLILKIPYRICCDLDDFVTFFLWF